MFVGARVLIEILDVKGMMGELMRAKESGPYHGFLPLKFELLNTYEYVSVCTMVPIGFTFIWFSQLCVGNSWTVCMSSYISFVWILKSRRKTREPKEENVTLGPATREGEQVFGVAHIFASFNDTFIVSINYCKCS